MEIRTRPDITKVSHANSGIRLSFMPGHLMDRTVATRLTAVPILPKPDTSTAMVQ